MPENPDGELRQGKRRLGGYTSFRSSFVSSKRKQGLILEISGKAEQDSQRNSRIRPGDDLESES